MAALLAAGVLSGCFSLDQQACDGGASGGSGDGAPQGSGLHTPWIDRAYLRTDPDATWDTLLLRSGDGEVSEPVVQPVGWTVETASLAADGDDSFSVLRVSPGDGRGRLDLPYAVHDCQGVQSGTISWDLDAPIEGKAAAPGQGVHVYTAGFWENGTLFYTNIKQVDHDDWPRAAWYSWEGSQPLPVYVYDRDRNEQPPEWRPPSSQVPMTGTPLDPVLMEAGTQADGVTGLGYFTTIPGFNQALKGLSTNTVRVVHIDAKDAYTRAGNEGHPLYGSNIVFYVKVVDVVDLPCPTGTARLCGVTSMEHRDGEVAGSLV